MLLKEGHTSVLALDLWPIIENAPLGLCAEFLKSPCIADIDEIEGRALVR